MDFEFEDKPESKDRRSQMGQEQSRMSNLVDTTDCLEAVSANKILEEPSVFNHSAESASCAGFVLGYESALSQGRRRGAWAPYRRVRRQRRRR